MNQAYQLVQVNIGRTLAPLDDPVMKAFVDQLDHINQLAENSPGFVWRLQSASGDATNIPWSDDPQVIVNMSVWESIEALEQYAYAGAHLAVLKHRKSWFEKPQGPILALWWVPAGTRPTVEDAKRALRNLSERGPTSAAFTFAKRFAAP